MRTRQLLWQKEKERDQGAGSSGLGPDAGLHEVARVDPLEQVLWEQSLEGGEGELPAVSREGSF